MDEQRYRVHGTITDEDGRELSHAAVTVWQRHLRGRRILAEGRADEDGRYRVSYEPPEHVPGKLLIVVGARPRKRRIAVESPVT
jgi:protocatechuate 3,4-dioxygenase beta subunit